MNRALHIAIVLTVAVHMVLGCCWHHAHASGFGDAPPMSFESAGRACEHHGHEHRRETCNHDGEEHGCSEESCIFSRSNSPEGRDLFARLQDSALISCLPAILEASWNIKGDYVPSRITAATRLHLLNQVLLI